MKTTINGSQLKLGVRYYIDVDRVCHAKFTGRDKDGDPLFEDIIGQHTFIKHEDGKVPFFNRETFYKY